MSGFKKFILRGNVVDLAVAVVIGAAFSGVINALVKDIITPLISLFGGLPDFSTWVITVGSARFMIGDFLNSVISFLVMAIIVYFLVVLPVQKLIDRHKPEPAPANQRECPYCLSKIPKQAIKCPYCTADLEPGTPQRAQAPATRQPTGSANGPNKSS